MPSFLPSQSIILEIACLCDVPTLLTLRLANRAIFSLINEYQVSICAAVTKHSFSPSQILDFESLDTSLTPLQRLSFLDYRIRTARWLAAVSMENYYERDSGYGSVEAWMQNVGAHDPAGDALRTHVATGWSVFWRLSDISRTAIREKELLEAGMKTPRISRWRGTEEGYVQARIKGRINVWLTHKIISFGPKKEWLEVRPTVALEKSIQIERCRYIRTLSNRQVFGWVWLNKYLSRVFWGGEFDAKAKFHREGSLTLNSTWLDWFILREGPEYFSRAWGSNVGYEECVSLIENVWSSKSRNVNHILCEMQSAAVVRRQFNEIPQFIEDDAERQSLKKASRLAMGRGWIESSRVYGDVKYRLRRRDQSVVIVYVHPPKRVRFKRFINRVKMRYSPEIVIVEDEN